MKIIFCYTNVPDSRAEAAIRKYAPKAEFVETPGLFGYNEAISSRWDGSDDLVVIEADKEITAEVVPAFSSCSEPWCTFAYQELPAPYTKHMTYGLGCSKFSAQLQCEIPTEEFIREDLPWTPCRHCDSRGCWNQLDFRMFQAFKEHGVTKPHVHGDIQHHHVYDTTWWQEWKKDWDYLHDVAARTAEIVAKSS